MSQLSVLAEEDPEVSPVLGNSECDLALRGKVPLCQLHTRHLPKERLPKRASCTFRSFAPVVCSSGSCHNELVFPRFTRAWMSKEPAVVRTFWEKSGGGRRPFSISHRVFWKTDTHILICMTWAEPVPRIPQFSLAPNSTERKLTRPLSRPGKLLLRLLSPSPPNGLFCL